MDKKRILDEDDLMVDFAEMTAFDFNSLDYQQIQELHKLTEYDDKPYAFKFGNFDVMDLLKSYYSGV